VDASAWYLMKGAASGDMLRLAARKR